MIYKKSFNDVIKLAKQAKKLKLLKSRFGSRFGRRFGSRRFGSRFGRRFGSANFPSTASIMGNYAPMENSIFSSYIGESSPQMISHLKNIDPSLRDNFYSNQKLDY
jgi:hypothetical protein